MEEDRLLQFHERLRDFIQRHLTLLINFVIVFIILIFITGGYVYYQKYKERKALNEYVKLIERNADVKSYQEFLKKYKDTQAGIQVAIFLWNKAILDNDIELIKSGLASLKEIYSSEVQFLTKYAEAKINEGTNNTEEAIRIYNSLLKKEIPIKESVMLDLAYLQERKNPEQAIKLYQQFLNESPSDDFLRGYVEYRLYRLQGK